jgi:hypothetical protein
MRLKKKSKYFQWQPRWFRLDFVSLQLEYFADAQCTQQLGRITFNSSSQHILENGILILRNVDQTVKHKHSFELRHNDAKALDWWIETLRLAELERKRRQ